MNTFHKCSTWLSSFTLACLANNLLCEEVNFERCMHSRIKALQHIYLLAVATSCCVCLRFFFGDIERGDLRFAEVCFLRSFSVILHAKCRWAPQVSAAAQQLQRTHLVSFAPALRGLFFFFLCISLLALLALFVLLLALLLVLLVGILFPLALLVVFLLLFDGLQQVLEDVHV